jgi:5-enolpyruvylshikimate-3-phosphate synthase
MAQFRILALVLALAVAESLTVGSKSQVSVNPIRRVVTLLQNMQKKVEAEGEKEKISLRNLCAIAKMARGI